MTIENTENKKKNQRKNLNDFYWFVCNKYIQVLQR